MLASAHKPIYDGTTQSILSIAIRLLGTRSSQVLASKGSEKNIQKSVDKNNVLIAYHTMITMDSTSQM